MSIYRNAAWFCKGLREYTKGGYQRASRDFRVDDTNVDLKGKSFLITGANSGLGKAVALSIARKGGQVHMVCRNVEKAHEIREEIVSATNNEDIVVHQLDISRPSEVLKFAEHFKKTHQALDVLINNAGCLINERKLTEDGIESTFATNTLGPFVLTLCLVETLERSSEGRVIFVSSGGMLVQKLEPLNSTGEPINSSHYDGTLAYAQTKRQQVHLAELFASKYPKLKFYSCHPGWADTPGVQSSLPSFYKWFKGRLRTVDEGADTIVWLAISKSAADYDSGQFFQDRQSVAKHLPFAYTISTDQEAESFWQYLVDTSGKFN